MALGLPRFPVRRVVSGGQTGVDRAALDVALELGIACGGWCPAGRRAEDGRIAERYPLRETPSDDPAVRTAWNVRDSDATLVLVHGDIPSAGTLATRREATALARPLLVVDLGGSPPPELVMRWLDPRRAPVLNVAGPRESECPGIHRAARSFLFAVLHPSR